MSETAGTQSLYGADRAGSELRDAFTSGQVPVAVYGLGKMGLPLAAVYGDITGNVIGADIDPDVVASIERGESHVDREPGLDELVGELVDAGKLQAVEEPLEAALEATVHVIIVPTLIDEQNRPDLSVVEAVSEEIGKGLNEGDFVIIESTVPPQTCRNVVLPILEEESGLSLGDFGLAFCPERTASGRALKDIRGSYPKVVGGADEESTAVAELIYDEINSSGVIPTSDITVAEAVKLFEGLYRDVNIALANELARFTDELGIDVNEALETANTAPYVDLHTPGPGVGGHCIPYYPYFLIHPFETDAPLLKTAREINDRMPKFAVQKLQEEFEAEGGELQGSTVLVLGLTYRPGVEETRATPALPIAEQLIDLGVDVRLVDPLLEDFSEFPGTPTPLDEIYACNPDAAVMVTPQEEFDDIKWNRFDPLVVIDGRQSLNLAETPHRVYTIGSGGQ
ncbi:nucleotide sugar dehydrogenase [Halobacterium salinarum]|uniref:UDP-N-acetyl-D-mannosamine dehydrogenase n=1 Tax=Halobacterium salinarum (strain ATCC 33171 / DSM 3754 / JCM 8978 / NBRC 102687 / NCIMB 764 / 91-R6) TaxID=2597657 RepID=A0A4D6GR55_HALS9|nr:nucleotide sugar dehydrogenase [Halobacterium salinarum]QCC44001.1 putative nucleotide sugar dehydrogenase [Halobacterium salinarum]TYO76953.1 UDP-N-acetyl-D-mannosaminuronic acid dehydrogenase [Halobacterium salinarum DSM 3754]